MSRLARRQIARESYRQGSILLLVLVAIIIMTLTTSSYLLLMRNEHLAARYSGNHQQTQAITQSGVEYLRVFLAQTIDEIEQQGGHYDNPDLLQDVLVIDDDVAGYRGRFTVIASEMGQGYYQGVRYGLENESAKLNLNSLLVNEESTTTSDESFTPRDRLLTIPGMDDTIADAILDWLDEDDSPRTNGAEAAYYQSLTPAYQPRNGPLAHLDELLMIQGVTPELLYGVDVNRNYLVDDNESPRGALEQMENNNGELNRGWSAYLTVSSSEQSVNAEGEPKIDLRRADMQALHVELQEALGRAEANFIIAYLQFGRAGNGASGDLVDAATVQLDFTKEPKEPINSLFDLIGANVSLAGDGGKPPQLIESPWQDVTGASQQELSALLDAATTDTGERTAGRININLASLPVLLAIPGMTETLADQILSTRLSGVDAVSEEQRHPIWLLTEGLVTLEELKPMYPYITTGGDVYSAQVVGFFEQGTARARCGVLLDRSGDQPRLLSWKDLSPLGPGFSRNVLSEFVETDK